MPTDLDIAQQATLRPITEIADELGLLQDELEVYGQYKAKVSLDAVKRLEDRPSGKYIVVTAMTLTEDDRIRLGVSRDRIIQKGDYSGMELSAAIRRAVQEP